MNRKLQRGLPALLTLALMGGAAARASQVAGNTIIGIFSNPVTQGVILNDPTLGQSTYENDALTAVTGTAASATDPVCASSGGLCWGTESPAGPDTYSSLSFTGSSFSSLPSGEFQVGTLTYVNGTSLVTTAVFGATLSFYLNSVTPGNLLATDTVIITTTENQYSGLGLTQAQLQTDADYVNICGNQSNICNSSIEAYEDSEGGTNLTVDLDGNLVGDPQMFLDNVAVDPNDTNPLSGGIVGNLPPVGNTPEPSSWLMLGTGLLGLGRMVRRKMSV